MKVAVIVSDFGAAANIGGDVERTVRTFDLPPEVAEYIAAKRGQWTTVTLAVAEDTP